MAVYYRMDELNDNLNEGDNKKTGLYPRVVSRRTVFIDELIELATMGTTMNRNESKAIFNQIVERMMTELKNGNSVCVDDFGLFSLTAKSRKEERVQGEQEIRAASIAVNRLTFRMSKNFLQRLGRVEFVRLPWDSPKRKKRTATS